MMMLINETQAENLYSSINNSLEEMQFKTKFNIGNNNVEIGISKLD